METEELKAALKEAHTKSDGSGIKEKSKVLHSLLEDIARQRHYYLKLRT